jgi:hypothetical protein
LKQKIAGIALRAAQEKHKQRRSNERDKNVEDTPDYEPVHGFDPTCLKVAFRADLTYPRSK